MTFYHLDFLQPNKECILYLVTKTLRFMKNTDTEKIRYRVMKYKVLYFLINKNSTPLNVNIGYLI